jgi:hypothetical protein
VNERHSLVLTETGVEHLPGGSVAVNVGPIVRALQFLTEGRAEDRGTDEAGNPLPDLASLAFDVIESIVLGGRKADYFRQVKRELDAQGGAAFGSSLALAKQAKRVLPTAQATALDHAADTLQSLLGELRTVSLDEGAAHELEQALEAFRSFGADRWVSATAQLLLAVKVLGVPLPAPAPAPRKRKRKLPALAKKAPKARPKNKKKAAKRARKA